MDDGEDRVLEMCRRLPAGCSGERGATVVEYVLLVASISVACIVAVSAFGGGIQAALAVERDDLAGTGETVCDGLDDDGNGVADEGLTSTWYLDEDGDEIGGSSTRTACMQPADYVDSTGDLDDADSTVSCSPGQSGGHAASNAHAGSRGCARSPKGGDPKAP